MFPGMKNSNKQLFGDCPITTRPEPFVSHLCRPPLSNPSAARPIGQRLPAKTNQIAWRRASALAGGLLMLCALNPLQAQNGAGDPAPAATNSVLWVDDALPAGAIPGTDG